MESTIERLQPKSYRKPQNAQEEKALMLDLGIITTPDANPPGNYFPFEGLSFAMLKNLVLNGKVNLDDRQNNAPSIMEFLNWTIENAAEDATTFSGYYIPLTRNDCRVTIEAIYLQLPFASQQAQQAYLDSFHTADEFSFPLMGTTVDDLADLTLDQESLTARAWWD